MKIDREESLYIKRLMREYKEMFSPKSYTVTYNLPTGEKRAQVFSHDDGIDFVIQYITALEKENEQLRYIERIINIARKEDVL